MIFNWVILQSIVHISTSSKCLFTFFSKSLQGFNDFEGIQMCLQPILATADACARSSLKSLPLCATIFFSKMKSINKLYFTILWGECNNCAPNLKGNEFLRGCGSVASRSLVLHFFWNAMIDFQGRFFQSRWGGIIGIFFPSHQSLSPFRFWLAH